MTETESIDPATLRLGLKKIRRRRWLLWIVILIYMPAMMLALESADAGDNAVTVFIAWIVLLCIAVGLACVVRCPRCGKSFHTHGPTFLPFRHCVHCCLHINADKVQPPENTKET